MSQRKLKMLLTNILNEIENNENITIDDIIHKMTLEMENYLFLKELNR